MKIPGMTQDESIAFTVGVIASSVFWAFLILLYFAFI